MPYSTSQTFSIIRLITLLWLFTGFSTGLYANDPADYEARREAFIQTALNNFNGDAITLQAYKGLPVDQPTLTNLLADVQTNTVADFGIVKLIRVLFLAPGTYDSQILPVLQNIPFWLTPNEPNKVYWSENHMIMWMSSDYLLHQKYGWPVDSSLDARLRHFLHLKVDYGFYEFFSSVYAPYCLSGLLNLADFATDPEIKSLATQASQRLLKDLLMLTNDQGSFFPAAGRNYFGKYKSPYGQNHNYLIWLVSGMGPTPTEGSHASNFLASSSLPVDVITNSWTPNLDTIYHIGHTLSQGQILNQDMTPLDKTIFQWSSGAYFHPDVAFQSAKLIKDYNLWNHSEFVDFQQFSSLPLSLAIPIANLASCISKSSVICGQDIVIYKNKSITLSSIEDFWKGKVGYQEHPCVANVSNTAVMTVSGPVPDDWEDKPESHANEHLPYVGQKQNVALIMYRPEKLLPTFGHDNLDVALHWYENDFDEISEDGMWLLGRKDESYVAVRRSCTGQINGKYACSSPDGQTWVIVIGNSDLHGSFDNFKNIIHAAQYEERWYQQGLQWVYYAKVVADGKTVEYAWFGDLFSGPSQPTGIINSRNNTALNIYPNPASDNLTMDLSAFQNHTAEIRISNTLGQVLYTKSYNKITQSIEKINTSTWPEGMYIISIESEDKKGTGKFLVNH